MYRSGPSAIVAVLGLLVAASQSLAQDSQLQGTWIIVSARDDGEDTKEPVGDKVTFTVDKMMIDPKDADDPAPPPLEISVDTTKTPHRIDITFKSQNDAKIAKGIFAVESGVLKLCFAFPGASRPMALESERDSQQLSLVFQSVAAD